MPIIASGLLDPKSEPQITENLNRHDTRIADVESDLNRHDTRIAAVESDVSDTIDYIDEMNITLNTLPRVHIVTFDGEVASSYAAAIYTWAQRGDTVILSFSDTLMPLQASSATDAVFVSYTFDAQTATASMTHIGVDSTHLYVVDGVMTLAPGGE